MRHILECIPITWRERARKMRAHWQLHVMFNHRVKKLIRKAEARLMWEAAQDAKS